MATKKQKRIIALIAALVVIIIFLIYCVWCNSALELNTYKIIKENLPKNFNGHRIAHVSDLHNAEMGKNNEKLLAILKESEPDMIAITGDLIDSRNTDVEVALQFAEKSMQIAPCYYVTGNHEARISEYNKLKSGLLELGVVVLENESVEIEQHKEKIMLLGVDDPSFKTDYLFGDSNTVMDDELKQLAKKQDAFTILLSHRPELFELYTENGFDLVLTGHAHGGQFRLPFIGGIAAPNQGFFPKYDAGLFTKENTSMIVSRGIGNSVIPLRFNNRPEVVLIELGK